MKPPSALPAPRWKKRVDVVTYGKTNAEDAKEKITLLDQLVRRAVNEGVPRLLKP